MRKGLGLDWNIYASNLLNDYKNNVDLNILYELTLASFIVNDVKISNQITEFLSSFSEPDLRVLDSTFCINELRADYGKKKVHLTRFLSIEAAVACILILLILGLLNLIFSIGSLAEFTVIKIFGIVSFCCAVLCFFYIICACVEDILGIGYVEYRGVRLVQREMFESLNYTEIQQDKFSHLTVKQQMERLALFEITTYQNKIVGM